MDMGVAELLRGVWILIFISFQALNGLLPRACVRACVCACVWDYQSTLHTELMMHTAASSLWLQTSSLLLIISLFFLLCFTHPPHSMLQFKIHLKLFVFYSYFLFYPSIHNLNLATAVNVILEAGMIFSLASIK